MILCTQKGLSPESKNILIFLLNKRSGAFGPWSGPKSHRRKGAWEWRENGREYCVEGKYCVKYCVGPFYAACSLHYYYYKNWYAYESQHDLQESNHNPWLLINRKLFILVRTVHFGPFVACFWPFQTWHLKYLFLQNMSDHVESWHTSNRYAEKFLIAKKL